MDPRPNLIHKISAEQLTEMLEKNWRSHDGRWQIAVVMEFGWEYGNKLNLKVTRELGKTIMFRLMKILGISRVTTINELRDLIVTAVSLNFAHAMDENQVTCQSGASIHFAINNCVIYDTIRQANATGKYECGCFALRAGFCDAFNLRTAQQCNKCLMKDDDACDIILTVDKW
jgi:hypothetical protein